MMGVHGEYRIYQNNREIIHSSNIITEMGDSFFLNRWINNEFSPISKIVLGKGTARPLKSDTELGSLSTVKSCKTSTDLANKKIVLSCDCTPTEILNTSEIGVMSDDILLSHDIYETITSSILDDDTTTKVHIEYSFNIVTGSIKTDWVISNNSNSIYYVYEPNEIVGVIVDGKSYSEKNSIESMVDESFFYERSSKNLYIKLKDDPNSKQVIIQTR